MADSRSRLDELLESWREVREGIVDEVRNIPASRFGFRPTPEARSVREQVQHILEVAMMATGEFTRPDTDLHRAPWPKLLATYARPAWKARTKAQRARRRLQRRSGDGTMAAVKPLLRRDP